MDVTTSGDDVPGILQTIGAFLNDLQRPHDTAGRTLLDATRPPRRTGRLDASITVDASSTGVTVGSSLAYAPVIHNGWAARNIRPQPFLTDALDATEDQVVDVYTDHITDTIRSA